LIPPGTSHRNIDDMTTVDAPNPSLWQREVRRDFYRCARHQVT
jgi:hypothetical protein